MDALERAVWGFAFLGLGALLVLAVGCATPHLMLGDALTCSEGGEYRESPAGIVVHCEGELRWTGPMSDKAAAVSLGILKGALDAAPIP